MWGLAKKNFQEKISTLSSNDYDFILGHPATHRLYKELIFREEELKGNEVYQGLIKGIYEMIVENLEVLVNTRVVFLLIGFIEGQTSYKKPVLQKLSQIKNILLKQNDKSGIRILLKHLNN